MTDPTLGIKLPMTNEPAQRSLRRSAGEWGQLAEDLGYDSVWVSEGWGADVFVTMSELACETTEIGVCSGIANVFSRSPAVLAMAATSIDRLSDGRAVLGVGASHPETVEGLHGLPYEQPIRRTHEAIEVIKRLTRGEDSIEYDGKIFDVSGYPPVDRPIPVYNGALGDANLRVTGRLADGWRPHLVPFPQYENEFETIAATARERGRDPEVVTVRPQVLAAVGDDADEARGLIRSFVADYIGRKRAYREKIAKTYPDETARIVRIYEQEGEQAATGAVSDAMVDDLGVAGDPEYARDRLRELLADPTVDAPIVYVPKQAETDLLERTLEELSPKKL